MFCSDGTLCLCGGQNVPVSALRLSGTGRCIILPRSIVPGQIQRQCYPTTRQEPLYSLPATPRPSQVPISGVTLCLCFSISHKTQANTASLGYITALQSSAQNWKVWGYELWRCTCMTVHLILRKQAKITQRGRYSAMVNKVLLNHKSAYIYRVVRIPASSVDVKWLELLLLVYTGESRLAPFLVKQVHVEFSVKLPIHHQGVKVVEMLGKQTRTQTCCGSSDPRLS